MKLSRERTVGWARTMMTVVCLWSVLALTRADPHPMILFVAWLVTVWAVLGLLWWGVVRRGD